MGIINAFITGIRRFSGARYGLCLTNLKAMVKHAGNHTSKTKEAGLTYPLRVLYNGSRGTALPPFIQLAIIHCWGLED